MHSNGQSVTQGRGGTAFLGFFFGSVQADWKEM